MFAPPLYILTVVLIYCSCVLAGNSGNNYPPISSITIEPTQYDLSPHYDQSSASTFYKIYLPDENTDITITFQMTEFSNTLAYCRDDTNHPDCQSQPVQLDNNLQFMVTESNW